MIIVEVFQAFNEKKEDIFVLCCRKCMNIGAFTVGVWCMLGWSAVHAQDSFIV